MDNKDCQDLMELKQIEQIIEDCGGWEGEHQEYTINKWKADVASDNTHLGYWQWIHNKKYGL